MESTSGLLIELDDAEKFSGQTILSASTNPCTSPTPHFGLRADRGAGPIANCCSSSTAAVDYQEPSVYEAADLLCSLRLNKPHSDVHCTPANFETSNCPDGENAECCSCVGCPSSEDLATKVYQNFDTNFIHSSPDEGCLSDTEENQSRTQLPDSTIPNCNGVSLAAKRCRHPTSNSSSSQRDYTAIGCDVIFSDGIEYRPYGGEPHLVEIMELVSHDLSEPYSIYTYRYFIYNWPHLCFRVSSCVASFCYFVG